MRDVSVLKALYSTKINVFLRNYVRVHSVIKNSKQGAKFKGIAIHGESAFLDIYFMFLLYFVFHRSCVCLERWVARVVFSTGVEKFQVDD